MNRIRSHVKSPARKPPRVTARTPNGADKALGLRVKQAMEAVGCTQKTLGRTLGVRYQQIGKYVRGEDRVSAIRLKQMADALGPDIKWFFEEDV